MSAFMFVIRDEAVKKATTEELNETLKVYNEYLDKFDWSKYQQTHFASDKASGWQAGKLKIEAELKMRSEGKNEELPYVTVPGYNPGRPQQTDAKDEK